jgi:hypothetical protein
MSCELGSVLRRANVEHGTSFGRATPSHLLERSEDHSSMGLPVTICTYSTVSWGSEFFPESQRERRPGPAL